MSKQMNDSDFSLKGMNVIITGASSGIGRECALQCSKYGANVVLVGRNEARLEEVYKNLQTGNHLVFAKDITEYDTIGEIVKESVEKLGTINGFIHSAGVSLYKPIHLTTPSDYENTYSINILSGFEFVRQLSKKGMYPEQGASYVFIASVMAVAGEALKTAYCSSKGAMVAGVRAMAMELAKKQIRVNAVSPSMIATDMNTRLDSKIPGNAMENIIKNQILGIGDPKQIALSCIFLLSKGSSFITGTNLIVDGGYTAH